jgi:site-specific DNA-methyltransferase (adenine-specific)
MTCELRLGRWQDALADVGECDALITDPPYSERTHSGHDAHESRAYDGAARRTLSYAYWTAADVEAFVLHWGPRTRGWIVAMTDHELVPAWEAAFERVGRYAFAPLQMMEPGSRVRLAGDGPAQWCTTIMVARPRTREYLAWGALPGGYLIRGARGDDRHIGGKPLPGMRALVRDYSRPGDLVIDPCAGGATTLLAARMEGRRAIGAEMDPATHALAAKRLAKPYTPQLFADELRTRAAANDNAEQADLFGTGSDGGKR